MTPEMVTAAVSGIVSGVGTVAVAARYVFKRLEKVDQHDIAIAELQGTVATFKAITEKLESLALAVGKVATDVAYMKGRFDGQQGD